jgi:hypothetical protein
VTRHLSNQTYRYQVREGARVLHLGTTTNLEAARAECRRRWPSGRFFQVGERTTERDAAAWLKKNEKVLARQAESTAATRVG